jgi:hypothetical protein
MRKCIWGLFFALLIFNIIKRLTYKTLNSIESPIEEVKQVIYGDIPLAHNNIDEHTSLALDEDTIYVTILYKILIKQGII